MGYVTGQRDEDDELGEDEVDDGQVPRAVGHRQNEGLEVLRDKDDVRGDEPDLGDDDGEEDGLTHPVAVQGPANIWIGIGCLSKTSLPSKWKRRCGLM